MIVLWRSPKWGVRQFWTINFITFVTIMQKTKMFISSIIAKIKKKRYRDWFFSSHLGNSNPFNLSDEIVKKANAMGFTAEEWVLYNLDKNNPEDYCSQLDRKLFSNKIGSYRVLLDNKIIFQTLIKDLVNINHIYAYKTQGVYHALFNGYECNNILDRLREQGKLVTKEFSPNHNSGCGRGFKILSFEDGCYYINGSTVSESKLKSILEDGNDYLIEEFCEQSDFENAIFPKSVNTIRFLTVVDRQSGDVKPLYAIHRMGASDNSIADNASLGGLQCEINMETGELSYATSYAPGIGFDSEFNQIHYQKHPVSGIQLEGLVIPDWENIKKQACFLHKALSYTGIIFIAWDFALAKKGLTVIEGNATCGFRLLQTHEGCKNNYIGEWFKDNGLL